MIADGGLGAEGGGEGVGEFLAIARICHEAAFCGVAEVTAF